MRRLLPALVGVFAVVALIAIATLVGASFRSDETTTPSTTPSQTEAPETTAPSQTATTEPTTTSPQPDPETTSHQNDEEPDDKDHKATTSKPPQWRTVLDGFATDFARPAKKETMKQWRKDVARWITPSLVKAYKTTDPRNLPNTKLDDITIESQGDEAVSAIIRYRGITPTWVVVQPTPDGWRITQVEPYDQPTTTS